jgi:hypothetical protein
VKFGAPAARLLRRIASVFLNVGERKAKSTAFFVQKSAFSSQRQGKGLLSVDLPPPQLEIILIGEQEVTRPEGNADTECGRLLWVMQ